MSRSTRESPFRRNIVPPGDLKTPIINSAIFHNQAVTIDNVAVSPTAGNGVFSNLKELPNLRKFSFSVSGSMANLTNAVIEERDQTETRHAAELLSHLDATLSATTLPHSRVSRSVRHFIGDAELEMLNTMTTFTSVQVAKLHAIFVIGQVEDLLPAHTFWNLLSVLHGGSLLLNPQHTSAVQHAEQVGSHDAHLTPVSNDDNHLSGAPKTLELIDLMPLATDSDDSPVDSDSQSLPHCIYRTYLHENTLLGARIFSFFDISGKGGLTFQEWVLAVAVFCKRATFIDTVAFGLELFDLRGDQRVSLDELMICANTIDLVSELARSRCGTSSDSTGQSGPPSVPAVSVSSHTSSPSLLSVGAHPPVLAWSSPGSVFAEGLLRQPRLLKLAITRNASSHNLGPSPAQFGKGSRSPSSKTTRSPSISVCDATSSVASQKRLYSSAFRAFDSDKDGHLTSSEYISMVHQWPQLLMLFEIASFEELCHAIMMQFRGAVLSGTGVSAVWSIQPPQSAQSINGINHNTIDYAAAHACKAVAALASSPIMHIKIAAPTITNNPTSVNLIPTRIIN